MQGFGYINPSSSNIEVHIWLQKDFQTYSSSLFLSKKRIWMCSSSIDLANKSKELIHRYIKTHVVVRLNELRPFWSSIMSRSCFIFIFQWTFKYKGSWKRGLAVPRTTSPFPWTLWRVCHWSVHEEIGKRALWWKKKKKE